jgi:hypothetical protein
VSRIHRQTKPKTTSSAPMNSESAKRPISEIQGYPVQPPQEGVVELHGDDYYPGTWNGQYHSAESIAAAVLSNEVEKQEPYVRTSQELPDSLQIAIPPSYVGSASMLSPSGAFTRYYPSHSPPRSPTNEEFITTDRTSSVSNLSIPEPLRTLSPHPESRLRVSPVTPTNESWQQTLKPVEEGEHEQEHGDVILDIKEGDNTDKQ